MIESKTHEEIHKDAVEVSGRYLSSEAKLISVLQEVDQNRTYLAYNESSLFAYATHKLRLSENVASTLIGIARKSVEIPELKEAIEKGEIPVSSARRLVPILTLQNSDEWLTKAKALAQKQLDFELARAFPGRPEPTRVRMKSGELARLEVDIDLETVALLCKLKDLLSQKEQVSVFDPQAIKVALEIAVEKLDPVIRAERALLRKKAAKREAVKQIAREVTAQAFVMPDDADASLDVLDTGKNYRKPINAELKHSVHRRDGNQCTESDGKRRCSEKRFLQLHHIRPVREGGEDSLENLRTLCWGHHRALHIGEQILGAQSPDSWEMA